jgi:predicted GNAT family acetyltransferase
MSVEIAPLGTMDKVEAAGAVPITNDTVTHRFEARSPEGVAVLRYHYDGAGSLVLDHTEVPAPLRHRGIATRLARTALEFARDHQVVVVPVCPFVVSYLQQHPDFNSLVRPTHGAPHPSTQAAE